jgi:hypothetical protein
MLEELPSKLNIDMACLDECTKHVRTAENLLRETNFNFEFTYQVNDFYDISWKLDLKSKKFRLMYTVYEPERNIDSPLKTCKPLIEANTTIRMRLASKIIKFLKEFEIFANKKMKELDEK